MLEKYYHISEATGVSITINDDGETAINACAVVIKNNQLSFEKKIPGLTTFEGLTKQIPAKAFIALNLSGRGILHKQIELIEEINGQNFDSVLPNANMNDFYVQQLNSGASSFVSVIRKAEADKWIKNIEGLGFSPLQLSLGPFPVQNIMPQLNVYGEEMIFDGHTITRNEQLEWISYKYAAAAKSPFTIKIETEGIDERLVIPYAAAFQLLLSEKIVPVNASAAYLDEAYRETIEQKKFKAYGFVILAVFFVLLLVNFLLFSWLNSSNAHLSDQMSRSAQSTSDVQLLKDEINRKELLLKTLGWEDNINKSILIDQLAALLPAGITWRDAAIDPVDLNTSRSEKTIAFYTRKIRITGNSEKIIPVNEWIARIKTKQWVKNVQLDSYTFNSELNTGQFTILIDY